jgi:hypothetical protein
LFTTQETANATGRLLHGRKVSVKALWIRPPDGESRLNLLSVQSLGERCGE